MNSPIKHSELLPNDNLHVNSSAKSALASRYSYSEDVLTLVNPNQIQPAEELDSDTPTVAGDSGRKTYSYNIAQAHLSEGNAELIKQTL